jgi:phosphoribosyl 1,2-cyclic phosphodiesterase
MRQKRRPGNPSKKHQKGSQIHNSHNKGDKQSIIGTLETKTMNIKTLASGSSGNCYWISDGHTQLLIEVGISWKKIQEALNFKTHDITAVIGSHGHSDHLGHAKDAMKAGIDVYCGQKAAQTRHLEGHRLHIIKAGEQFDVGTWTVRVFEAIHDVEAFGFLLANKNAERLLYLTDSQYSKYRFNGLTHIAIECNFVPSVLSGNVLSGDVNGFVAHRTRRSHMSLDTVIELLKANDLSHCRAVYLLHLSSQSSDEARMIREVQEQTGIPTFAAGQ